MHVLAVDPGLTVGYATYQDGAIYASQGHKWDFLDWVNPDTYHDAAWFDFVICERFTIGPQTLKMSRQPHPIEVIGVLRWWCEELEVPFIEQTPAEAKSFMTNDRLKQRGVYLPGNDHANDATRHLILYLIKERILPVSV